MVSVWNLICFGNWRMMCTLQVNDNEKNPWVRKLSSLIVRYFIKYLNWVWKWRASSLRLLDLLLQALKAEFILTEVLLHLLQVISSDKLEQALRNVTRLSEEWDIITFKVTSQVKNINFYRLLHAYTNDEAKSYWSFDFFYTVDLVHTWTRLGIWFKLEHNAVMIRT